ncbi:eugenol synthase 1-like [Senna tora]|uniref:Eugenol synthase 1-like n=1 Tax=Senna tora TaxID=362788 RepID=A0A834TP16_9FABA|nr:eugenol synthase 1-like [Senna tora]
MQGELDEHELIVAAIKQVDIVICTLPYPQVMAQLKIIHAIKLAGNHIKRFLPSDFGCEEDKVKGLPPFETFLEKKREIRRAIEAAGIPYTFVSANCFAAYFINFLLRPHQNDPNILVYGDGEAKAILNYEEDIAMYTIKAANDVRACNRIIVYRPCKNIISQNELISVWEKKSGRNFKRVFLSEQHLLNLSQSLPCPENIPVSIIYSIFVKGELMKLEVEEEEEGYMEASRMYPEYQYKTIDQLLDLFLVHPPPPASAAFE